MDGVIEGLGVKVFVGDNGVKYVTSVGKGILNRAPKLRNQKRSFAMLAISAADVRVISNITVACLIVVRAHLAFIVFELNAPSPSIEKGVRDSCRFSASLNLRS